MPFDTFLKLDGIKGESQDQEYKDQIEVLAFDWTLLSVSSSSFGGGGPRRPVLRDLVALHRLQSSSPQVMLACANGTRFKDVVLALRKTVDEREVGYLKVTMEDCLVSSYQQSGSNGGELLADSMSLNFAKMTVEYKVRLADGSFDTSRATWDFRLNKGG